MRANSVLRLVGFAVLAILPTALAQTCTKDNECDGDLCCMGSGECSTRNEDSVLGGEAADDLCECLSDILDEASGTCLDCSKDKHCDGDLCCILSTNECSSNDEDTVLGGEAADDLCECLSDVLDEDSGLCMECSKDKHCDGDSCCILSTNTCSSNDLDSVLGGEAADDLCECLSDVLDEDSGLCMECSKDKHCDDDFCCILDTNTCSSNEENTVAGGEAADDVCECLSGVYDSDAGTCSGGCTLDKHCEGDLCCMANFECSTSDVDSVPGGDFADDICECVSNALDADTGFCEECSKDKHCEDTFCCILDTGDCSSNEENTVLAGEAADDTCECLSDDYDSSSGTCIGGCTLDKHCEDDFCCMENSECSTNAEDSILGGQAANDACECASGSYDSTTGTCTGDCTLDKHCDNDSCCMENGECSPRVEQSVLGGDLADDACECASKTLDAASGTCECSNDTHCEDTFCCMDTNECSSNAEDTVLGGEAADDLCECLSDVLDEQSGLCEECSKDKHCEDDFCCTGTNSCSTREAGSVDPGGEADDDCECVSNSLNAEGVCECDDDDQCPEDDLCCPEEFLCKAASLSDPTACGDPHMTGFHGQKFDFTGNNGAWYAVLSDPLTMHLNMRVTAPVPSLQVITYITGLSLITKDDEGVEHTVVIAVKEPNSLDSACPENVYPCLADGALNVVIDGNEELVSPGTVSVGPGMQVTAVNIPGECRSFGFEKYWERKKQEYAMAGRRLSDTLSIGEWVLADPTATNMVECATYVAGAMAEEGGMFAHQSEHVSFQIVTPTGTIRLSHGRLHQLPMRDPTDRFDLPDHLTWQMNMAIDHTDISRDARGILGETFVPTLDEDGNNIMRGMESIRGTEADYAVAGPLGVAFAQGVYSES